MDAGNPLDSNKPSGPIKVGHHRVVVDRNLCIGAASCIAIAPKTFALDNEAKAIILDSANEEDFAVLLDSAKSCPVAAIIITDETGKQIFP